MATSDQIGSAAINTEQVGAVDLLIGVAGPGERRRVAFPGRRKPSQAWSLRALCELQ